MPDLTKIVLPSPLLVLSVTTLRFLVLTVRSERWLDRSAESRSCRVATAFSGRACTISGASLGATKVCSLKVFRALFAFGCVTEFSEESGLGRRLLGAVPGVPLTELENMVK